MPRKAWHGHRERRLALESSAESRSSSSRGEPAGAQTVVIRASPDGCLSPTRSPKETCLAPNTNDSEEERDRDREGKRQRQTEGERDSENKSTFYSCLLSAYHILDTPLDPGTTDILILTAKAQLATFIIVVSCMNIYWEPATILSGYTLLHFVPTTKPRPKPHSTVDQQTWEHGH